MPATPVYAEEESGDDGRRNRQYGRNNHLTLRGGGADADAGGVIRLRFAVHEPDDFLELPAHFHNNPLRGFADRFHGQRGEDEGAARCRRTGRP